MFYHTPDVRAYVSKIIHYRYAVIGVYVVLLASLLYFLKPQLVTSDELYWLNQSKAWEQTHDKNYQTAYVSRLTLYVTAFDQSTLEAIHNIERYLVSHPAVYEVHSLFNFKQIYNDIQEPHSALVKVIDPRTLAYAEFSDFLEMLPAHYIEHETDGFKLHFYLYASTQAHLDPQSITLPYSYSQPRNQALLSDYLIYILAIILSIVLMFRWLFHNYISGVIALVILFMTLLGALYANALFTEVHALHLATALIVVAIALVDYLYFYYRWHVSHYKANALRAMHKTINRNLFPALWTSIITVLGLGGLLFVDSIIVRHLSMSVIAASTFAYVLNITFLPALLSFFSVKHPKVAFAKICYAFAQRELFYHRGVLKLFLAATLIVLTLGVYMINFGNVALFTNGEKSGVISAKLPHFDVDYELVSHLLSVEASLQNELSPTISIQSIASVLKRIHDANYPTLPFDESHFLEALMYMQLYGFDQSLIDEASLQLVITFDPEAVQKGAVLDYLDAHETTFYLTDVDSLVNRAKASVSFVLVGSLLGALLLVGAVMGRIFRAKEMMLVGFMVNATPIVWFGLILVLLGFPITIEALIAMTITLALGSDATVHFAYKYFRSRYFGRTQKHALEIMFFYSGVPVIIGSMILTIVFVSLTFTTLHTLQLIGVYGAILMLLSLLTDLFVLPVMLLAFDRYFNQTTNKK